MAHKIQIGHSYTQDSISIVFIRSPDIIRSIQASSFHLFLLFLEENLFSVLVPSMYEHRLSGIPFENTIRDSQTFSKFKRHLKHTSSRQPLTSPPSDPLSAPWFSFDYDATCCLLTYLLTADNCFMSWLMTKNRNVFLVNLCCMLSWSKLTIN